MISHWPVPVNLERKIDGRDKENMWTRRRGKRSKWTRGLAAGGGEERERWKGKRKVKERGNSALYQRKQEGSVWQEPMARVHTVTEPSLSLFLSHLLPLLPVMISVFCILSSPYMSPYPLHHFSYLCSVLTLICPHVFLSNNSQNSSKMFKQITQQLQHCVYLSPTLSLFIGVQLSCVFWLPLTTSARLLLNHTLIYPNTHTHFLWQLCCFGGMGWLISLYGDNTSCNEQESWHVNLCSVGGNNPACVCVCVCCSSLCMLYISSCECWYTFFVLLIFVFVCMWIPRVCTFPSTCFYQHMLISQ